MARDYLKQISIEYLRGSVLPFTLMFEKGKPLTIVYGENGTGKSTICDAFEFIGQGKVGSLEDRGLGRTKRYWPSLGKRSADVLVQLDTSTGKYIGKIDGSNVLIEPANSHLQVEILRRKQILSLIEATSANRYEEVKTFINVSEAQASEEILRNLITELEKKKEQAETIVTESNESIRPFWEAAKMPDNDPLKWAEIEAARDISLAEEEANALEKLHSRYTQLQDAQKNWWDAEQKAVDAKGNAESAKDVEDNCATAISHDAKNIIAILDAAKDYLDQTPSPEKCPLCESEEKVEDLSVRVSERRKAFSALIKAQELSRRAAKYASDSKQRANVFLEALKSKCVDFTECKANRQWPDNITLPPDAIPTDPKELKPWLASTNLLLDNWKSGEHSRRSKTEFVTALKLALENLKENTRVQNDLACLVPRLQKALQYFVEERRQFTDSILSAIADEVGRLYEIVHPEEGLSKISLMLDPSRRASLNIGADFHGIDAAPQAYYSDSHLDTLGLCIFLALAALDEPEKKILVLDDVLASVDEPHVDRLIQMLYTETARFRHCVITTHYRPWKHKFRWGWLKNKECQFVELDKWTNVNGLTIIQTLPDVERLRILLAEQPPDPQLICAKAGYILEATLNFLTLLYECSVPRKSEDRYTIGDLLPAIKGKLRKALRVDILNTHDDSDDPEYTTVLLEPLLTELNRIADARNVFGCHFKELSFDLLDSDAIPFGQQVLDLMDILTDQEAGWPKNSKSGEYWATSGNTRRLYPLRKPC